MHSSVIYYVRMEIVREIVYSYFSASFAKQYSWHVAGESIVNAMCCNTVSNIFSSNWVMELNACTVYTYIIYIYINIYGNRYLNLVHVCIKTSSTALIFTIGLCKSAYHIKLTGVKSTRRINVNTYILLVFNTFSGFVKNKDHHHVLAHFSSVVSCTHHMIVRLFLTYNNEHCHVNY